MRKLVHIALCLSAIIAGAPLGQVPNLAVQPPQDHSLRIPVGKEPEAVLVSDVNGDQWQDLVTANSESDDLSVVLGSGNGNFRPEQRYPAGKGPHSLAAVDVNRDKKIDLVTANTSSDDVSVLLGDGSGTFAAPLRFAAGHRPVFVVVIDLNKDGAPDIITANESSLIGGGNGVFVLLGKGDGTFGQYRRYPTGDGPVALAAGDMDGDRNVDLVTANSPECCGASTSLLLGSGDGALQPPRLLSKLEYPASVLVENFNRDRALDFVTANSLSDDIAVFLGRGDGSFLAPQRFPVGRTPYSVSMGDLNRDGSLDLATANAGSSDVSILMGKGDGTFQSQHRIHLSDEPVSVAIADLNGDGKPDLVATSAGRDDLLVIWGNGDGTFRH